MVVVAQSRLVFQGLGSGSVLKTELVAWMQGVGGEKSGMTPRFLPFFKLYLFFKIYLFGCAGSYLQQAGPSVFTVACGIFSCGMWDLAPDQGSNWAPSIGSIESCHRTTTVALSLRFLADGVFSRWG